MTDAERLRMAAFDRGQADVLHMHLRADPGLAAVAKGEMARCAEVIAAGRLCHVTEMVHAALSAAIKRAET